MITTGRLEQFILLIISPLCDVLLGLSPYVLGPGRVFISWLLPVLAGVSYEVVVGIG